MNKLGAVLFSILLLCGGLLWGLAPESFNQYIKQEIETFSTSATQHQVKVSQVNIQAEQGVGVLSDLTIFSPLTSQSNATEKKLMSVDAINIAINPKTLNTPVLAINELELHGVTLHAKSLDKGRYTDIIDTILQHINNQKINEITTLNDGIKFHVKIVRVNNMKIEVGSGAELKQTITYPDFTVLLYDDSMNTESKNNKEKAHSAAELTTLLYQKILLAIKRQVDMKNK